MKNVSIKEYAETVIMFKKHLDEYQLKWSISTEPFQDTWERICIEQKKLYENAVNRYKMILSLQNIGSDD